MKRIASVMLLTSIMASTAALAEPDVLKSSDGIFEYAPYGAVTSYYGDDNVYVPPEIDGTKITEIGVMAFFNLDISSVYIENGIETINTNAFQDSRVMYVELPESVKTVGEQAFLNCARLSEVTLNSEDVEFEPDAFKGTGFVQFDIPCTANEKEMRKRIAEVKGNDNFSFGKVHSALVESNAEKDAYGGNMLFCENCGFKQGEHLKNGAPSFADVPEDAWYGSHVTAAYGFGILNGKSEGIFAQGVCPNAQAGSFGG